MKQKISQLAVLQLIIISLLVALFWIITFGVLLGRTEFAFCGLGVVSAISVIAVYYVIFKETGQSS